MRVRRMWALLAIAAALCVTVPTSGLCVAFGPTEGTEVAQKEWAVYIYCGADNDFEEAAEFALDQCVAALAADGTDPGLLHVIAFLDRQGDGATDVYEVTPTGLSVVDSWDSHERDSSDPETMTEFLDFVTPRYPGDNTLVVVKNGHAWCGVCPDWNSQDEKYLMPVDGLASVLNGRSIDVLALDGDNMASLEVAYELRGSTKYFVGTQQDMPLDGLPYYLFLKDMATVSMAPKAVAENIVYNHVLYYNNTEGKKTQLSHLLSNSAMAVTAAAFDLGDWSDSEGRYDGAKISAVVEAFEDVVTYMMEGELPDGTYAPLPDGWDEWIWVPTYRNCIASARDSALIGKMADQAGYEWLPDVYQWLNMLVDLVNWDLDGDGVLSDDEILDDILPGLVEDFHATFNESLVKMEQCQILNRSGNSWPHGLNIWFPPTWTLWESLDYTRSRTYLYDGSNVDLPAEYYCVDCPFEYDDIDLDFVDDTPWMAFFDLYYDSRWVIYGNPDAPRETPLWQGE